ncbi:ParB/RepB/Spo0J family partition protein [Virgibacillus soli]|uniref:ParB N-terminal domain-containing protein n=1 Tax=Paracerasibacillus soli TaxID=480284 RepID=A0ABU5CTZ6_9BACI|nr:ParB N-terminal domain-containing protein [Virgibacillus soli]MDY0409346.1 ParB N-terminal domain-containing protein [Virgibacillus soli]
MYRLKIVKLSQIELEDEFRSNDEDLGLELDIKRNGLTNALMVEQKCDDKYILVDGHRRFRALQHLGIQEALCQIEEHSSTEERIIKRLREEFHTKKRTPSDVEDMIEYLLDKGYTVKRIASECNVTVPTIKKYIRGLDVDPKWKEDQKKANVGHHVMTDLHELKITKEKKEFFKEKYLKKEINGADVKELKRVTKMDAFARIPKKQEKSCLTEVTYERKSERNRINNIVYQYRLTAGYDEESHTYVYYDLIEKLKAIEFTLGNKYFVDNLTPIQHKSIGNLLKEIQTLHNPDSDWENASN